MKTTDNKTAIAKIVRKLYFYYDQELEVDKVMKMVDYLQREFEKKKASDHVLEKMFYELVENYKTYRPLCIASILTALHNVTK
jgi:hypothetical protein